MVLNAKAIHERILASVRLTDRNGCWHLEFRAMGTSCRVTFAKDSAAKPFQSALLNWVAEFEAKYSRFLADSLVSEINRNAGYQWVAVDPETERLLALCDEAHFLTHGVFDPTSLPLIQLWNWKAEAPSVPTDQAIQAAKTQVSWRKVKRVPGKIFLPERGMCQDSAGSAKNTPSTK